MELDCALKLLRLHHCLLQVTDFRQLFPTSGRKITSLAPNQGFSQAGELHTAVAYIGFYSGEGATAATLCHLAGSRFFNLQVHHNQILTAMQGYQRIHTIRPGCLIKMQEQKPTGGGERDRLGLRLLSLGDGDCCKIVGDSEGTPKLQSFEQRRT